MLPAGRLWLAAAGHKLSVNLAPFILLNPVKFDKFLAKYLQLQMKLSILLPQLQIIQIHTGLSKSNGAKLRESFCPAAASHSRPCQAGA